MAEPLNATFFALKPRERAVLLPATLVMGAIGVLIVGAFLALNWGTLNQFFQLWQSQMASAGAKPQAPPDDEAMRLIGGMFALIGSAFLLLIPLYIALAAYEAACLRWMIRGEAPGVFGFALDHDTWRVYGVYWCWVIGQYVLAFVVSIVTLPIVFASMGNLPQMTDPAEIWRWQLTVQLPLSLLQYIPMIFFGVRFGPAAATSIVRKRFSFFDAWKVTRGRFWMLFGSFATVWAIAFAASMVASAPVVVRMWPIVTEMFHSPSPQSLSAYFAAYFSADTMVWVAAGYAVATIAFTWMTVMTYGINARAALAAIDDGKVDIPAA